MRQARIQVELFAFLGAAIAACTVALVAYTSDRGLDFTDEGHYLNWISRPFAYDASRSQFGFIYHPLFRALNGDIATLRLFNVGSTMALGCIFSSVLIRRWYPGLETRPLLRLALSSGLAASALVQLHWLPLTPNYNWLNLSGVLCFLTGTVFLTADAPHNRPVLCGLLLGVGVWLCGMAKPPTALLLGVLLCVCLLPARVRSLSPLLIAIGSSVALLCLTAWAIDGSIQKFVARLILGQELGGLLRSGHTLDRLLTRFDPLRLTSSDVKVFFLVYSATLLIGWLSLSRSPYTAGATWIIVMSAGTLTFLLLAGVPWLQIEQSLMQEIWLAAVPAGIVTVAVAVGDRSGSLRASSVLGSVLVLLLAPAAYAIGTGNNQWFQAAHLLIAWLGATAIIVAATCSRETAERLLAVHSVASATVAGILVCIGVNQPYRSFVSLRDQTVPTAVGPNGARLKLNQKSAEYVAMVRDAAHENGFTNGTPVLDLTGRHPTTVYAMGGVAPGLPWLISGYQGSRDYVRAALARVACNELASAWVLVAIDRKQPEALSPPLMAFKMGRAAPLPPDTLAPLGLDLQTGYRRVIEVASPVGYGWHALLAPTSQKTAAKRCEEARSGLHASR